MPTTRFTVFVLLALALITGVSYQKTTIVNAEQPETTGQTAVSADMSINLALQTNQSIVTLDINLRNQTKDDVVTTYTFPNLWYAEALASNPKQNNNHVKVKLNSEKITFDFGNKPLKPKETYTAKIVLRASGPKTISHLKYIYLDGTNLANSGTKITKYDITSPPLWGEPTYLTIKSELYELKTNAITLYQPAAVGIIWGKKMEIELAVNDAGDADAIKLLTRQSASQKIKFTDADALQAIYKDESDNIYSSFKSTGNNSPFLVDLEINPNLPLSDVAKQPEYQPNYNYERLQLPKKLKPAIENLRSDNKAQRVKIDQTINLIKSKYQISPVSTENFDIETKGFDQKKALNYAEYLVLLNESLAQAGIQNNIVLVELAPYNLGESFWLEVCAESICEYYLTDPNLNSSQQRLTHGYALQMIAFDGLNRLAFSKIQQLENEFYNRTKLTYTAESVAGFSSIETDTDKLDIKLQLPEQTPNFKDFSTTVEINNRTSEPIFLNSLVIENNTFPIIDNALGGVHQGVLPGETKSFTIDNVFLPKVFIGMEQRTTFELKLMYEKGSQEYIYPTQHSILLSQNMLFVSLIFLGVLSLITSTVTASLIYQHNKYLFISSYWRGIRSLSDLKWQIDKRSTKIKKLFTFKRR